jgi:lipoate-protein ligase A
VEEYIMQNQKFEDEYFLFWRTSPTVMIGRFQNTIEEINMDFIKSNNMNVVRRNSGGGTIYTDENCWQFSFIIRKEKNEIRDFRDFTKPVTDALKILGINTEFSGRNDLMLNGKKFSGNAQFSYKNQFLHHGSILFDANLENLIKSITVSDEKLISKGIKSIKERVINLKPNLFNPEITSLEFKDKLLTSLNNNMLQINLTKNDLQEIEKIEKEKFLNWDWNYGRSPEFNITKNKRFIGGKVEVFLIVKNGIIQECKIYGDFFFNGNIIDLENKIIGNKYEASKLYVLFKKIEIEKLFYGITSEDFLQLFIQ